MLESDDRWNAALEASGLGVWDWNLADKHTRFSGPWMCMRGFPQGAPGPTVDDWPSWVHPDDRARVSETIRAHFEGRTPLYECELRMLCHDGEFRWVLARGKVCERDADGRPLRVIGTNLDIDDAKKAAIRAQRHARLHQAIAACNIAIAQRQSIDALSEAVCRIFIDSGEIIMAWIGRPSADGAYIVPAVNFTSVPEGYKHLHGMKFSTDPKGDSPYAVVGAAFRTGKTIWIDDFASDPRIVIGRDRGMELGIRGMAAIPIQQKSGPAAILMLYTDSANYFDGNTRTLLKDMVAQFGLALDTLEAEKTALEFQASLRRSEKRMRAMFDKAPLGIALKDSRDGRYLDVNAKFEEIVGYDREMLLGMRWQDITHPDDAEEFDLVNPAFLENAQIYQKEKRYIRPDGTLVWVNMTIAHFETAPDGSARHLSMVEDITERRELQMQLSQRQRLEALGQLTGGIAHDFNNLLTVIIGNSEVLAQELGEGDLGELAGLILSTGERAADLTGRLLTFARKQSLSPRSIKIDELVDGLVPFLRRAVPAGIQLKRPARFSSQSVFADPAQLEMALLNLVLNARDAMPEGGCIEISSENFAVEPNSPYGELPPGDYVVLSLADNGTGMQADALEQAFDPFFTTKMPGQGSGLGLSMVYGFARQSGGHVELFSRPGEGTTVKLYLPATNTSPERMLGKSEADALRGEGEIVLIAEDDDVVRKFVVSQVASLGYRTVTAPDGHAALEVLRSEASIQLLFTDIAMVGGMDGIELAGHARAIRPALPVLFTSGHAEQHLGRLAAIDALLLRKPYRRRELAERLREALDIHRIKSA